MGASSYGLFGTEFEYPVCAQHVAVSTCLFAEVLQYARSLFCEVTVSLSSRA